MGIDGDPVGSPEQTGLVGTVSAPLGENIALVVNDGHPSLEFGNVYLAVGTDVNVGGLAESSEQLFELAFLIEDLEAVILSVTDQDVAVVINPNAVRQVEVARIYLSRKAP